MARRFNNKELILSALLKNYTLTGAAKESGVSISTIKRAVADPDFKRELDERRKALLDNTCMMLQTQLPHAVKITSDIMADDDNSPQIRLNASDMIMRNAMRMTELCSVNDTVAAMKDRFEELNIIDSPIK